ncbi:hypothetical protein WA158_006308 [Blastocystis sp. Blastoise]
MNWSAGAGTMMTSMEQFMNSAKTNQSDDQYSDSSDSISLYSDGEPWIDYFCGQRGNEYLAQIDDMFIRDAFNLYGLSTEVPHYDEAIRRILEDEYESNSESEEEDHEIEESAELLYGLIHARYILTGRGLEDIYQKFKEGVYGCCPRVCCQKQHLIPAGQDDAPGIDPVKVFCPRCKELYYPSDPRVAYMDGAFFGTTFAHMFILSYPECTSLLPKTYTPTIYGFKIHPTSPYYHPEKQGPPASSMSDN